MLAPGAILLIVKMVSLSSQPASHPAWPKPSKYSKSASTRSYVRDADETHGTVQASAQDNVMHYERIEQTRRDERE